MKKASELLGESEKPFYQACIQVKELESENDKLRNIAARVSGCLWDYHKVCPVCGNEKGNHMQSCKQIYETDYKSPKDFQVVFDKAFDIKQNKETKEEFKSYNQLWSEMSIPDDCEINCMFLDEDKNTDEDKKSIFTCVLEEATGCPIVCKKWEDQD